MQCTAEFDPPQERQMPLMSRSEQIATVFPRTLCYDESGDITNTQNPRNPKLYKRGPIATLIDT